MLLFITYKKNFRYLIEKGCTQERSVFSSLVTRKQKPVTHLAFFHQEASQLEVMIEKTSHKECPEVGEALHYHNFFVIIYGKAP